MPRPRGGDWLNDELQSLKCSEVSVLVSFLELNEVAELDLGEEQILCETNGIAYLSFPISDRSVPSSSRETMTFVRLLLDLLAAGNRVVLHCRQGVGRSGLMAAFVLAMQGMNVDEAFTQVSAARGCPVPDTEEQREWVARCLPRS